METRYSNWGLCGFPQTLHDNVRSSGLLQIKPNLQCLLGRDLNKSWIQSQDIQGFIAEVAELGQVDLGILWTSPAGIKPLIVFTHSVTYNRRHVNLAVVNIIN